MCEKINTDRIRGLLHLRLRRRKNCLTIAAMFPRGGRPGHPARSRTAKVRQAISQLTDCPAVSNAAMAATCTTSTAIAPSPTTYYLNGNRAVSNYLLPQRQSRRLQLLTTSTAIAPSPTTTSAARRGGNMYYLNGNRAVSNYYVRSSAVAAPQLSGGGIIHYLNVLKNGSAVTNINKKIRCIENILHSFTSVP